MRKTYFLLFLTLPFFVWGASFEENYDVRIPPVQRANAWLKQERSSLGQEEGENYAVLTTLSPEGFPFSRVVECSELSDDGSGAVLFYSYGNSNKAKQLKSNAKASLHFWLRELEAQIDLSGSVEEVSRIIAEDYWNTLSREEQLFLTALDPSNSYRSTEEVQERVQLLAKTHTKKLPFPEDFTGFRLLPQLITLTKHGDQYQLAFVSTKKQGGHWQTRRKLP